MVFRGSVFCDNQIETYLGGIAAGRGYTLDWIAIIASEPLREGLDPSSSRCLSLERFESQQSYVMSDTISKLTFRKSSIYVDPPGVGHFHILRI